MTERRDEHKDYELIALVLSGEGSAAQQEELESRRKSDPEFAALYDSIQRFWELNPVGAEVPKFNTDRAWEKVSARVNSSALGAESGSTGSKWWIAIAAAVLLLIGFFVFQPEEVVYEQTLVAQQEMVLDTLPDASVITLNKASELKVNYANNQRNIELKGEAFFDVARDEQRPFVISSGDIQVEVLGTSFNVKALQGDSLVEVWVKSGKVKFYGTYAGSDSLVLTPGQKGIFNKNKRSFKRLEEANLNAISWKTKTLIFDHTYLHDAVRVLEQVYGHPIKLENEAIQKCQLSVEFENESLELVMEVISQTFNLEIEQKGDTLVLTGDGCP